MIHIGQPLPQELWNAELLDGQRRSTTLDRAIRGRSALILFLRHFGCTGCSQQVDAVVPHVGRLAQLGISTVLIGNGDPHFIGGFVERQRLDGYPLELYTDPTRRVFELAGLDRSAWRTLGPTALLHELRARAKGYFSTAKEGDVFQQGGALLVDRHGAVVFAEAAEYAAKPVDTARVVEAALLLAAESAEAVEVA